MLHSWLRPTLGSPPAPHPSPPLRTPLVLLLGASSGDFLGVGLGRDGCARWLTLQWRKTGGPSSRALARPNALRPRKVDIGPAQVVLLTVFFLFCFFLFSFMKFKQFKFRNLFIE
jgi:hypothetical protein